MKDQRPIHKDAEIIEELGGCSELAKKLGMEGKNQANTVRQWRYRGIPARVILANMKLFGRK